MCFESFESPGCYIARDSMLATFSCGRPSSLVVDLGASGTRITPIVDGHALERGTGRAWHCISSREQSITSSSMPLPPH
jgi:actin-related protein